MSMLRFEPKNKEEAFKINLIEKGDYPFKIISAKEKTSYAGEPLIELTLVIYDQNAKKHIVFDCISPTYDRFHRLLFSIGEGKMAENGELFLDKLENKEGLCKIYIKEDKKGQYPTRNAVSDYMLKESLQLVDPDF